MFRGGGGSGAMGYRPLGEDAGSGEYLFEDAPTGLDSLNLDALSKIGMALLDIPTRPLEDGASCSHCGWGPLKEGVPSQMQNLLNCTFHPNHHWLNKGHQKLLLGEYHNH